MKSAQSVDAVAARRTEGPLDRRQARMDCDGITLLVAQKTGLVTVPSPLLFGAVPAKLP
ncbi:MAG: hypothetical protein O7E51_08955 [Acidobacteria bacterium]|nr:hypothetical protein [Acidobacteriota bacterium]